jgi:hypothetical protein
MKKFIILWLLAAAPANADGLKYVNCTIEDGQGVRQLTIDESLQTVGTVMPKARRSFRSDAVFSPTNVSWTVNNNDQISRYNVNRVSLRISSYVSNKSYYIGNEIHAGKKEVHVGTCIVEVPPKQAF